MALSIATHKIMKLSITTVSIMDLFATISINGIQHNDNPVNIKGPYADCFDKCYAECHYAELTFMLSVLARVPQQMFTLFLKFTV